MCGTFEAAIPPKPGANQNFGLGDESRRNRAGVWRKGRVVECFSSMRAWRFGALVCRFWDSICLTSEASISVTVESDSRAHLMHCLGCLDGSHFSHAHSDAPVKAQKVIPQYFDGVGSNRRKSVQGGGAHVDGIFHHASGTEGGQP